MSFSANGIVENVLSSFNQTGLDDLFSFALRHRRTRRWMIASDFNLGAQGAAHNVFAFAAYPIGERNYFQICDRLRSAIPADFKHTRVISQEIRSFFRGDDCFCFVILAPTARMYFREHSDHQANLLDAIDLMDDMYSGLETWGRSEALRAQIGRLREESRKRNFSLSLLENMLVFAILNAFVSYSVASATGADFVGWFPDRDNMTTYADSVWAGLAHANFHGLWTSRLHRPAPGIGLIDHRVRGTNDIYDPLIRVPDYLAATTSRWHLEQNSLDLPEGTTDDGRRRYHQIIRSWAADNRNLWIGRIFRDEDGFARCARIAVSRPRRRRNLLRGARS